MSVRLAMKFTEIEVTTVHTYALDDTHAFEQKLDGTRALAVVTQTGVRFLGHGGQPLKHAAAAQHFDRLRTNLRALMNPGDSELVLDGEILTDTGEYWLFDAPYTRFGGGVEYSRPSDPLRDRRVVLEAIGGELAKVTGNRVHVVPQAAAPREKVALIGRVEASGGEGLMVKRLDSPYEPGKRATHSVKAKFIKTADVVVLARDTAGSKNATLGVHDSGYTGPDVWMRGTETYRPVGGCSMIGKPDAQPGDVIEVAYLYWTGARLYQPRMIRVRADREPASCAADQFPAYSREVLR